MKQNSMRDSTFTSRKLNLLRNYEVIILFVNKDICSDRPMKIGRLLKLFY